MLLIYLKIYLNNIPLFKENRNLFIDQFRVWIKDLLSKNFQISDSKNGILINEIFEILLNKEIIEKIPFDYDLLIERMGKNELISSSHYWTEGVVQKLLLENPNQEFYGFSVDDIYDFESAKRVYFYFKKYFESDDYDLFLFTKENLTTNEKISFLHDIL